MLKIINLSFAFLHQKLFSNLNVCVRQGELAQFVGPNGVGKSTCLRIVAGLISHQEGRIEYWKNERDSAPVVDRREYLEYLPAEANGLFLKMGARENLELFTELRGERLSQAALYEALERFDLNKPLIRERFPLEKFSTGMKRRLSLVRLALSPAQCWVLDEPLYGLDQKAVDLFRDLLRQHLSRGGSALLVSHDIKPFEGLISSQHELAVRTEGGDAAAKS